jgi:hypothetical protein
MKSRLRVFAPAVLAAAGAVLLSACDAGDSAGGSGDAKPDKFAEKVTDSTIGGPDDVECGPVDPESPDSQVLMAETTPDGTVGCEEAFNVLAEYSEYPIPEDAGSLREATLDSGWTCAMIPHPDYGNVPVVYCTHDGLVLYTKPAEPSTEPTEPSEPPMSTEPSEPTEPTKPSEPAEPGIQLPVVTDLGSPEDVDCGSVPEMIDGQNVMAMATPWGTVGCDEAHSVVNEYRNYPDVQPGEQGTLLPSGWACASIEHKDFPGEKILYCDNGFVEEVGEFVDGLAFYTMPVS